MSDVPAPTTGRFEGGGVGPKDPTRTAASPPAAAYTPVAPSPYDPAPDASERRAAEEFPQIPGYRVLRKIGQGGQGSVYLAESMDGLKKQTAIKLFPKEAKASYTRELEAWRRVEEIRREHNTPHLVEGYTAGTTPEGLTYVVMAFFEKASLADQLATEGPIPPGSAVRYARHTLAALDLLHRHGLFHRDVKPQNLLLGSDGLVRLADYGLSKPLGTSVTGSCTPAFAAPEQLAGEAGADGVKIDIYGVGATLFALLTGKPPVPGRPDVFLLEKLRVPRPVQAVLLRSLSPDPAVRFDSAQEFARALAQADPQSSGRLSAPLGDLAAGQVGGNELVSPTVAASSSGVHDPFRRPLEADGDAITRDSRPKRLARRRTARAKAAIGAAALFALGALVAEGIREQGSLGFLHGSGGGGVTSGTIVIRPTPVPTRPPKALVLEPRGGAVALEGARELGASDGGLSLVGTGGVFVWRQRTLARVPGHATHALAFGQDAVLVARPDGGLELVTTSGARLLEAATPDDGSAHGRAGAGKVRALAASSASSRIAVARRSGAVVVATVAGDRLVGRALVPGSGGGFVTGLAFDDAGERLALTSLGADGVGHVAVFSCGAEGVSLERLWDDAGPLAVAWLDAGALVVGGLHGEVAVVEIASGRRTREFAAFDDEVTSLARVAGQGTVLALGDDRRLVAAPFPGAVPVRDGAGGTFWFAARPARRVRGWRVADLLGGGREPITAVVDSEKLDGAW